MKLIQKWSPHADDWYAGWTVVYRGTLLMLIGPIVLILAATPMLCGQLSPKGLLGPGTHGKGMSDEEWYKTNRVAGGAFLIGGLVWLAAAILLPGRFDTMRQEQETIAFIGAIAVSVAMVVSVMYVEGESEEW